MHRIPKKDDYSIGTIHKSNNFGYFKILSYEGRNHNSIKMYKIQFIKTGYITVADLNCIKLGKIKDHELLPKLYIGKSFKCNCGSTCTITEYVGRVDSYMIFKVIFETGYVTTARLGNIINGKIKDPLYPSECGIGYLGLDYKRLRNNDYELYEVLYSRWRSMLHRCYSKSNHKYHIYGALGVTVSERWHNLSNYINDVKKLPGFDRDLVIYNELQLDKDKLQQSVESKVYSKNTCCWISAKEQSKYIDYEKASSNQAIPVKCIISNNLYSIEPSISSCSRKYNIPEYIISSVLKNKRNDYNGHKFEYIKI